ncbi:MAG: hypothetical protein IPG59_09285 [Candidatus Melainabacteria bacterium]|nr:MAG: hypothetical protein IPG59_09285 [Candidatus Melainabacteria bacterium]
MTTLIFCNQEAGSFESCSQEMGDISDCLSELTGEPSILTDIKHVTDEQMSTASRAIAMGGDGTVGRVLARVAKHNISFPNRRMPVGIIAAGTGNLLADTLGLKAENPQDALALALKAIETKKTIAMDMGLANGTPFALDFAVGPVAMAVTEPGKMEKGSHGMFSYVRPLMKAMFGRPYRFAIEADGQKIECDASAIFITNPHEMGIGQRGDASSLRDGNLNLLILDPQNLDEYVGIAMRFGAWFLGSAETDTTPYKSFDVKSVKIEAISELSTPQLLSSALPLPQDPVNEVIHKDDQPATLIDGDEFGTTPAMVTILPGAVDVFVPLSTAV